MEKHWIQVTAIHGMDKRKELVDRHTIKRVSDYGEKRHIVFSWHEAYRGGESFMLPVEHLCVTETIEELQQLMNQ